MSKVKETNQCPDSKRLLQMWHEKKQILARKDFGDNPWRLAYEAFMTGFAMGFTQGSGKSCDAAPDQIYDIVTYRDCVGLGHIEESVENGERLKKVILDDFKCVVGFEGDSGEWEAEDTLRLFIKKTCKDLGNLRI